MSFLSTIFGDANERYIKSFQSLVDEINRFEPEFEKRSDEELKAESLKLKARLADGETLDDILPEAFAAVREASKRTLGQRHFDVQLMGGIVLHQGKIAEMRTGEGKTLVATLPAYLNALSGKGVHIVTVNDYLARRDMAWMGQIYHLLGLSVGCINHDNSYLYDPLHSETIHDTNKLKIKNEKLKINEPESDLDRVRDLIGSFHVVHEFLRPVTKKEAYSADITYGTNNEYGFDYLRDNMAYSPEQMSQLKNAEVQPRQIDPALAGKGGVEVEPQRVHNFAIVDEVDSILIDEARTPLIISAPDSDSTELYKTFSKVVPRLAENEDYNVDEKLKAVSITEAGIEKVEKMLGLSNIYDQGGVRHVHHLEQALKAQILFKRDRDYVVKDGEVIIVDEFTGRLMPGRRWSEGLHQAVEAKEGVSVQKESRTLATITFQNYFRLYKKLAGMTGTARTSAEEFHKVYNIEVISVPTNKQAIRQDLADRIYKTEIGKFKAVAREIKERNKKGQPVLVGTVSIQKNELMSKLLEREGVEHRVLNAKQHEKEAELHAQAGRLGAVTVATNMAGRGVDIILGGNPPQTTEAQKVKELGGLHVIGTERHEARRIDDQLRGRSGRQGDPGSSQFFVSTEDDVIRVFGGDRLKNMMETLGIGEEDVIENRFISRAIEQAQFRIEGHNFDIRKYVLEYDDVMNKHREAIYRLRKEVLFSKDMNPVRSLARAKGASPQDLGEATSYGVKETVLGYVLDVVNQIVTLHAPEDETAEWNLEEIAESIKALIGNPPAGGGSLHTELIEIASKRDFHKLSEFIFNYVTKAYEAKEKEIEDMMRPVRSLARAEGASPQDLGEATSNGMRQLEKFVLLRTIDELWMDHIEEMEHLRDSVRLRAYGQRDPLIEYKIEGQKMFERLQDAIKGQVANLIFKVSLMQQPRQVQMEEKRPEIAQGLRPNDQSQRSGALSVSPSALSSSNIGRNDPCPCGSGKKYKKCHLNRKS